MAAGKAVRHFSAFSILRSFERAFLRRSLPNAMLKTLCSPLHHGYHLNTKRYFNKSTTACSDEIRNPSDFQKLEYAVPVDMVGKILGKDKQVVNQIKALSGSVIRYKKETESVDNEKIGHFIIGGTRDQINKAIELIQEKISKKSFFDAEDGSLIWAKYRRNFKGQRPPESTRHKCIRAGGERVAGNPCPLCSLKLERSKDVSYEDVDLLKQFICPHSGKILSTAVTGLCRKQQENIARNIEKSRKHGLLPFTIPLPDDSSNEYKPVGIPSKHTRIRR